MRTSRHDTHRLRLPQARGVSLIYSLLALVAISLAAVALVRSVTGGSLVVGNLAFKQDATASASIAAESAVTWLTNNSASLTADAPTAGYYASTRDSLDVTGTNVSLASRSVVDWDNNDCSNYQNHTGGCVEPSPTDLPVGNGNTARFIILRQCSIEGNPAGTGIDCTMPVSSSTDTKMAAGGLSYQNPDPLKGPAVRQQYYRVIVRTRGARNSVSFTETLIQF